MRTWLSLGIVAVSCSLALAGKPPSLADQIKSEVSNYFSGSGPSSEKVPKFAFDAGSTVVAPQSLINANGGNPDMATPSSKKTTIATAVDGKSAWIASDLEGRTVGDSPDCDTAPPDEWFRVTALFEVTDVQPVVWHFSSPVTAKAQQASMAKGPTKLDDLPKAIGAGAEDAVKVFEGSLADPKAFAQTVSDRKDVVLYGSERSERYVGGAAVKKQLAKWNLALKVETGVQAGVTASKTVAWIGAHVDAVPAKNPKAKPTPYRLLLLYEKTGADWKIVSAHFSFI